MTYQQYYNKLVSDISASKRHLAEQNKLLKGEKGYLDTEDMYAYMSLRNDLNSLLSRCDEISNLITGGRVNPQDEIDPIILPDIA
jgi:hypothetical protein